MNIPNNNITNNNKITNGFSKNSPVFDIIGIPNNLYDPYGLTYGKQLSNNDINNMMIEIINNIPNLNFIISGFFTSFFEKPIINLNLDYGQLELIILKMLNSENQQGLKTSSLWIKQCNELLIQVYNNSNDTMKLLIEKKDSLLNFNLKNQCSSSSGLESTKYKISNGIEILEKSIQELLIFLSGTLDNIDETIGIYYECIFIYIAFIKNVDLLWEIYELNPILIAGGKQADRYSNIPGENISSFRERLHLFIRSFIKDVGKTSMKSSIHHCWNDMYKILIQDLVLYPQKTFIYSEMELSNHGSSKCINLPENDAENYILRIDAKYFSGEDGNNNQKDYITGCYGMSFYNTEPGANQLSFILNSKIEKFITIRLYGMVGNCQTIKIDISNPDKNQSIVSDTIVPLNLPLANYLPSSNNLNSNQVGFTNSKKIKLTNNLNLIKLNFDNDDSDGNTSNNNNINNNNIITQDNKKYFLYFIEILVSYQKD